MKKIALVAFTILLFFFLGVGLARLSQSMAAMGVDAEGKQLARAWSCLKTDEAGGHRVKLSVADDPNKRPLPNATTFIIECLDTPEGTVCTTGNGGLDVELFGENNLALLENKYEYKLEKFEKVSEPKTFKKKVYNFSPYVIAAEAQEIKTDNPTTSTATRDIGTYEWQDYTPQGMGRTFYAMNFYDPQQIKCETQGGQQQCTFTFEQLAGKCTRMFWDPYGRVFDAQSLEPVRGASLRIFVKREDGSFTALTASDKEVLGGVANPAGPTLADGRYSFLVGSGIYKLEMIDHPNFSFNLNPLINPNYTKAYSDIYPKGAEIDERYKEQHRDIPVVSKGAPIKSPVTVMEKSEKLDKANGLLVLLWRFSHPFTQVNIFAQKPDPSVTTGNKFIKTKTIFSGKADKHGWFKTEINQSKLLPGESLGVEYQKTDLTTSIKTLFPFGQVLAQDQVVSSVTVDPIPNYIEGYAKDANGNLLPGATVGVYLSNATKPYYQTKADSNGHFKISSEYLPFLPYKMRYFAANGTTATLSSTKFMTQNTQLISDQKLNLYEYKDVSGKKPQFAAANSTGESETSPSSNKTEQSKTAGVTQSQPTVVLLIILLLLIGVVGLILGVYLLKKSQIEPPPPMNP